MAKAVNITDLTRAAIKYNNVLRTLPFYNLNEICRGLNLNILEVQGEDKIINKRRKAGIIRPYKPGLTLGQNNELLKFFETLLKPEMIYAEIKDNITQYKEKKVISNQGEWVDNKTKKHPLEYLLLQSMVLSFTEDIAFNLWFAERDDTVASPTTAFTGFFPKMDILQAAGEISTAKGNLVNTGAFVNPVDDDDTDAYEKLVEFVGYGNNFLRNRESFLYSAENPITSARRAFRNKVKTFKYPTVEEMLESLREDAKAPGLKLKQNPILGTGDKLTFIQPGLLDIGVSSDSDKEFVQVRTPYTDPNDAQFWIQASYDTRIQDIHPKLFQTNEQVNEANDLAGDY